MSVLIKASPRPFPPSEPGGECYDVLFGKSKRLIETEHPSAFFIFARLIDGFQ